MDTYDAGAPRFDRRTLLLRASAAAAAVAVASAACPLRAWAQSAPPATNPRPVRVRIWCEATAPRSVYPHDIDGALAEHLARNPRLSVQRARLTDPQAGLSNEALDETDVLIWWGHLRHDDVPADRSEAVVRRVREGRLGLVALHSSCASKPFKGLMGMSCEPGGWRQDGRPEHVAINATDHPIVQGVRPFTIPRSDMFTEPFSIPEPESVLLVSSWDQGESVRSGLTWTVEKGRVVYLRTGHEAFPVLFHPSVRRLISNATLWAARRS